MRPFTDLWPRLIGRKRFSLASRLPEVEVAQRLTTALRYSPQVHGRVGDGKFWMRRRIAYSNPFRTHVLGELQGDGGGTRLSCISRVHLFTMLWFGLWFAVAIVFFAQSLIDARDVSWPDYLAELFSLLILLAFGVAIVGFGRWLGRDDEAFLLEFVKKTTDAQFS